MRRSFVMEKENKEVKKVDDVENEELAISTETNDI